MRQYFHEKHLRIVNIENSPRNRLRIVPGRANAPDTPLKDHPDFKTMSASEAASSISESSWDVSSSSSISESCVEDTLEPERVAALRQSICGMEAQLVDLVFGSLLHRESLMDWLWVMLGSATAAGNEAVVQRLLAGGVKTETPPERSQPAPLLHLAANNGDESVVKKLLEAGADVHEKDSSHGRRTALHHAAAEGNGAAVRALVSAGASMDALNVYGWTSLHEACSNGHRSVVVFLLMSGACAQMVSRETLSPLHLAAMYNHHGVIEDLLSFGNVSIGRLDAQGRSALHMAAQHCGVEACLALLRGGAVVGPPRSRRMTCLDAAASRGHTGRLLEVLAMGVATGDRRRMCSKALSHAISADKPDTISDLVALGADVEYHRKGLYPNLHAAVLQCANRSAEVLLRAGANVQTRFTGGTPLHLACSHSLPSMVKLLLHWGADEQATNSDGDTPLAVVGSFAQDDDPAFQEFMENRDGKRIRNMLEKAPADRIWRRRGWLVLCRARWLACIAEGKEGPPAPPEILPDGATGAKKRRGKASALIVEPREFSLHKGKAHGRNEGGGKRLLAAAAAGTSAGVSNLGACGVSSDGGSGQAAGVAGLDGKTRFVAVVEQLLLLREDSIFREVLSFL